jgi:tRNA-modifying protein YgfZ
MSEADKPAWTAILPRAVVAVTGPDTDHFLQGLISNDIARATPESLAYAFMLSPQGKYLFEFFIRRNGDGVQLDTAEGDGEALAAKLRQYKLRAKVSIGVMPGLAVAAIPPGGSLAGALPDPRLAAMGARATITAEAAHGFTAGGFLDYEALRLSLGVPEGSDFVRDQSFLLECNGEELHGVDFRKGCYIGQELTARMKHRGTARRRILRVSGSGLASGQVIRDGEREIGTTLSFLYARGLAAIRLDRWREAAGRPLTADGAPVEVSLPAYPLNLPPQEDLL